MTQLLHRARYYTIYAGMYKQGTGSSCPRAVAVAPGQPLLLPSCSHARPPPACLVLLDALLSRISQAVSLVASLNHLLALAVTLGIGLSLLHHLGTRHRQGETAQQAGGQQEACAGVCSIQQTATQGSWCTQHPDKMNQPYAAAQWRSKVAKEALAGAAATVAVQLLKPVGSTTLVKPPAHLVDLVVRQTAWEAEQRGRGTAALSSAPCKMHLWDALSWCAQRT